MPQCTVSECSNQTLNETVNLCANHVGKVFTPVCNGKRVSWLNSDIKVLSGKPLDDLRVPGYCGTLQHKTDLYNVFTVSCGLPSCYCDKEVRKVLTNNA